MSDNDMIRRGDALALFLAIDDLRHMNVGQATVLFAERRAALIAIPAVQPTVKPLVWRDDGTNGHETDHAFGFHEVYPSPEGDMLSRDGVDSGVFPTLEAAKAAAQADYEARILSALDMQPTVSPKQLAAQPDDVAALVEAVIMLNAACDAMWNDHERLEENPDILGQKYRLKEIHLRAISKAQQNLPPALARVKGETK